MTRLFQLFGSASVALALCAPAVADEVRLKGGRVLVGTTKTVGDRLLVETEDGLVKVPLTDVLSVRTSEALREELAHLTARTGPSAFARLQLARTAAEWGLDEEMWKHLESCMAKRPKGAVKRRMHDFLGGLEKKVLPRKYRKGTTAIRVREIVFRARRTNDPVKLAVLEELLVREPDAGTELRRRARGGATERQRLLAVRALNRRPEDGNDRFVYRTTILDSSAAVRNSAADLIAQNNNAASAVRYLAPGLAHSDHRVRVRTARAYGRMRDQGALELLAVAGPRAATAALPGGATRAHMAIVNQQSYIRDFDVEVAQASFIADPKIDVLQSGVVLDVTVHAVTTIRTQIIRSYRDAIREIAGADPGRDPKTWLAWLETRKRQQRDG